MGQPVTHWDGLGLSPLFSTPANNNNNTPIHKHNTQGEMFVNGAPLDDKKFLRISEYVQHEDVFVPTQTLRQALEYHANLRLGPVVSRAEKRGRIDALLLVRACVCVCVALVDMSDGWLGPQPHPHRHNTGGGPAGQAAHAHRGHFGGRNHHQGPLQRGKEAVSILRV